VYHIVVTHGYLVDSFSKLHGGVVEYADYCSIVGVHHENDQAKMVFDGVTTYWNVLILLINNLLNMNIKSIIGRRSMYNKLKLMEKELVVEN
jgi:hypothetical protein